MERGIVLFLIYFGFQCMAFAQLHSCPHSLVQQADEAVDHLNSWDRIYDWYEKYRLCDDGGLAEGVSEAVARNLADRWQTLPRFDELAKNPGFKKFVLRHVNETLSADDFKKINMNAVRRCPTGLRSLCEEVKKKTANVQ